MKKANDLELAERCQRDSAKLERMIADGADDKRILSTAYDVANAAQVLIDRYKERK